jgi:hypothetical protein
MAFHRIMSGIAGLAVLISFLALPTSCGEEKQMFVQFKVPCTTTLNVNTQTGVDVVDAYVCKNTTVTWQANDHTFCVVFKHGCPFGPKGCNQIDNQHPSAKVAVTSTTPTVYDYGILVDGQLFDPHIIPGGG